MFRRGGYRKGDKVQVIARGGNASAYYLSYGRVKQIRGGLIRVEVKGTEIMVKPSDIQPGD